MRQTPRELEELTASQQARVPYLGLGFEVGTLDRDIHERILGQLARKSGEFEVESVPDYLHTTNSRSVPSFVLEDRRFNAELGKELRVLHEHWCGRKLTEATCYGIRIYQAGSFLYNHVDTIATHIVSSSICVDCRLNKPWPFYIEDIEGRGHEVSLRPGEMLFYESARLKHGRPYPLDGDFYAAMFVHYTPIDWKLLTAEG